MTNSAPGPQPDPAKVTAVPDERAVLHLERPALRLDPPAVRFTTVTSSVSSWRKD